MSTVDRAALIEATEAALGPFVYACDLDAGVAAEVLDAVLPLIADALEAQQREFDTRNEGLYLAARLVRSLLSTDSDQ
jgi:hypothetical protein